MKTVKSCSFPEKIKKDVLERVKIAGIIMAVAKKIGAQVVDGPIIPRGCNVAVAILTVNKAEKQRHMTYVFRKNDSGYYYKKILDAEHKKSERRHELRKVKINRGRIEVTICTIDTSPLCIGDKTTTLNSVVGVTVSIPLKKLHGINA